MDTRMGICPCCKVHFPIETLETREMTKEEKEIVEEAVDRERKRKTNEYLHNLMIKGLDLYEEFHLPPASEKKREEVKRTALGLFPH